MADDFPTQARAVIIGGGIVGCSLAYHLTRLGWRDVVLLEQGRLSSGTTWHAAGLVGQLRSHANMTRLIRYSTELYAALEAGTGLATGWKQCGSITVARTAERMTQLRRTASTARAQGVEIEVLTPAQAGEKWPIMRTGDLAGAVWLPGDGKANPTDLTQALARGARARGARIFEQTRVAGIRLKDGAVSMVETNRGTVACDVVAICAGQWSREIGRMCGVTIPLHSAEHMYIVTERIDGVHPDLPVMRDPDGYIYFKEEVGGLVMGGFEPDAKPWGMDGIPADFEFQLLPDDWDQFEILMKNALERVPALETAAIKTFLNGPESFTPDNNFILGEAPETRNVFVAAGFNSMGIASAGGAGRALAEWIVGGEPSFDLWPVDIRRFARFNGNRVWLRDRVKEVLGLHYAMPWPNHELTTARPFRRSPLFDRLAAKGAVFGSKMGWERPNWFAPPGIERRTGYSFGRQNWFAHVAEEHRACREGVALFDMTSFAKFLMQGPDSEQVLQTLCANDVSVPAGRSVYTPMLNERGGFESDLTVARLAPDCFLILTGTAQATRDAHWIRGHIPGSARAVLTDVTSGYAVIGVMGPRSRELLGRVTHAALDQADFPFGTVREIGIGYATVWASRRSYMGELGWELYVPSEFAVTVYETLAEAGGDLGVRDAGYYAIESLRLEKGHRAWGRELTPDDNPWEAGLGFAVQLDKKGGFIGREALAAARGRPLTRRLVSFLATAPDTPAAWGGELVTANGDPIGGITSAAYGYTLGGVVALGWVRSAGEPIDPAWLAERRFALDVAGEPVPVRARVCRHLTGGDSGATVFLIHSRSAFRKADRWGVMG
ncbi:FAD-dependent oxidoreductase [Acidiphilium sp. AL]|uniref:GcvT family protein n=1 Tax=Acidiphilium sp. AL TaxID=2871704 RepID=UPI0021CB3BBB|nr:FAD-dependent oxidoreductase [Acidiphilium sp. AL]MCU4161666.1 FAD-dependent oxidoreductase [Acidiphilium sp. AL]